MVWYQKFEYAIYHWFHKATENMMGCVTYRPGCISLFRMSSSKIENIFKKYTAAKTDRKDYVQYDQGKKIPLSNYLLVCLHIHEITLFILLFILQREISCFPTYYYKKAVKWNM